MRKYLIIGIFILSLSAAGFALDEWIYATDTDTYANEKHPDSNYGNHYDLRAGFVGQDLDAEHIIYLYFDISNIDYDVHSKAALYIACIENYAPSAPFYLFCIHPDEDTWSEDTLTWNNRPDWRPTPVDEQTAPYNPGGQPVWAIFDATEAIYYWLYANNRGLAIIALHADIGCFASSEYGGGWTPKLHIYENTPFGNNLTGIKSTSLSEIKAVYK